jgi:thiamine biosynthesis lipoprotein
VIEPAMRLSFLILAFLAALPLSAQERSVRYEASHDAMGTDFTVVAYGRDAKYLGEVANEVFEEIDRLDDQMSNYKPESEISALNRDAARRAMIIEPALFALIQDSWRYSRETDGAFDITVGPLMRAWGFFRGQGRVPNRAELAKVIERLGYRHVRLDAERREVQFDREGVELDLGGIAKGYAVDHAVAILRENGVTAALVSSGTSSLYALGAPPGERGWKVNVRDPFEAGRVGDVVWLKDYSLSASGSYEKFFTLDGKTYAHIMDPRTGRPVENMLASTVLAPRATQSDALSTAFFVLGPQTSRTYLATHPNLAVIFYQPGPAKRTFRRVILHSTSFRPPAGSLAEISPP